MAHLNEKTINKKLIYEGKIISLSLEEVELPNGKLSKREIVNHPGAVAIIALSKEGKLQLVNQYRKALGKTIYEIPAGKLEKGEDPHASALRELKEETGYSANELQHLVSFYTSPGFADELVHLYFTDTITKGARQLDDDEFLDNCEVTLTEAVEMVKNQEIHDAKTVYAVQYLQLLQAQK